MLNLETVLNQLSQVNDDRSYVNLQGDSAIDILLEGPFFQHPLKFITLKKPSKCCNRMELEGIVAKN